MSNQNKINPGNRIFKAIQNYICSDDDIRPAMQGMAIHDNFITATDGHKAIVVEMNKNVEMPPTGIMKFDTSQSLNADFAHVLHDYIDEQFPCISQIFAGALGIGDGSFYDYDANIWDHAETCDYMDVSVDVFYDLMQFFKKVDVQQASFYMPANSLREDPDYRSGLPIAFNTFGGAKSNIENLWGVVMPHANAKPIFNKSIVPKVKEVEKAVNEKELQTA